MNPNIIYLADILEYPGEEWLADLAACAGRLEPGSPPQRALMTLQQELVSLSTSQLQELYVRTFELNAVCTLDIGYQLFGENYKRGILLANLAEMELAYDLGQERQLPDYLPVLLRLLARIDDIELRNDMIVECILPAVRKMEEALATAGSSFHLLFLAINLLLSEGVERRVESLPERPDTVFLTVLNQ